MELEQIIEGVQHLTTEQLEEVKQAVDKELSEKRGEEIKQALEEAKKLSAENKLKYYSSAEDMLSSLNED